MRVFLVAGEASGDSLGAALMRGLRQLVPGVSFDGVGGPLMQAEGLESRFPMEELSVMGLAEVLPRYPHLRRRMIQTAEAVVETGPDVLITIDSPDFCLRVAERVKTRRPDLRTVHYVAPSVWAWRPGRAEKMARHVDHVLALLPFEPPYMEAAGMDCDFVGHPVVSEPLASAGEELAFRQRHGMEDGPLILALPGSRRGEVSRLAPIFGAALEPVVKAHPGARVVVPCASGLGDLVADRIKEWPGRPMLIDPDHASEAFSEKRAAFRAADVALAASGTVSLELAAVGTPMVIAYDMAWLSRVVLSRMLRVDTVTLVNLVSETRAVPEFIGADCRPDGIGEALIRTLERPGAQEDAMRLTMERLGRHGEAPGLRAARAVLKGLGRET